MNEHQGDLYAQREERPSLEGEVEQGHALPSSNLGHSLRLKMRALRRRKLWLRRAAMVAIVIYVLVLTILIPIFVLRKPVRVVASAPTSNVLARTATPVVASSVVTNPAPPTAAPINPQEGRLAVQQMQSTLDRLREARGWIQKGRLDTARTLLQTLLTDNPDNVDVQFELAQITYAQEVNNYTRELLQHILRADPTHKNARQMLAVTYLRLEQYESALALVQWILEGDPESVEAHRIAGLAHLKMGRFEQAAIHFRKWSVAEPHNIDALKFYADAVMNMKDYGKAADLYEDILQKRNVEADAYRQLAVCYARMSQVDKTVATLTQAQALLGAPRVTTWFKDPGFDSVRTHSLFATFERNISRPMLGAKPQQAGETTIDMNSVLDAKRLDQIQGMLKRK